MPKAISENHVWVVAATVVLTDVLARQAVRRGTVRLAAATKIEALETYCDQCRRPFADVHEQPCIAAENRDHLIGGPTGERKKKTGDTDQRAVG